MNATCLVTAPLLGDNYTLQSVIVLQVPEIDNGRRSCMHVRRGEMEAKTFSNMKPDHHRNYIHNLFLYNGRIFCCNRSTNRFPTTVRECSEQSAIPTNGLRSRVYALYRTETTPNHKREKWQKIRTNNAHYEESQKVLNGKIWHFVPFYPFSYIIHVLNAFLLSR